MENRKSFNGTGGHASKEKRNLFVKEKHVLARKINQAIQQAQGIWNIMIPAQLKLVQLLECRASALEAFQQYRQFFTRVYGSLPNIEGIERQLDDVENSFWNIASMYLNAAEIHQDFIKNLGEYSTKLSSSLELVSKAKNLKDVRNIRLARYSWNGANPESVVNEVADAWGRFQHQTIAKIIGINSEVF